MYSIVDHCTERKAVGKLESRAMKAKAAMP